MSTKLLNAAFSVFLASQSATPPPERAESTKSQDDLWKLNASREATFLNTLKVVGEPSLLERSQDKSAESYRFIWVLSANYPVCVRLDVLADGSGVLITKYWTKSETGSGSGKVNSEVKVSKEEVTSFVASVHKLGLWSLPYAETLPKDVYVMDGVSWIFEEASHGNYHVIARVSPKSGAMFELGNGMFHWTKHIQ